MKYRFEHIRVDHALANHLINAGWEFDWSLRPDSDLEVISLGVFTNETLEGLTYFSQDKKGQFNYLYLIEIALQLIGVYLLPGGKTDD